MNGGVSGAVCRACLAGSYSSATGGLKIKTSVQPIRCHLSIFKNHISLFSLYTCILNTSQESEKAKKNKRFVPVYQCLNKTDFGSGCFYLSEPMDIGADRQTRERANKVWLRKTAGISLKEIHQLV
jgi:hypothetical protein